MKVNKLATKSSEADDIHTRLKTGEYKYVGLSDHFTLYLPPVCGSTRLPWARSIKTVSGESRTTDEKNIYYFFKNNTLSVIEINALMFFRLLLFYSISSSLKYTRH